MSALSDQVYVFYSFEEGYKFLNSVNFSSPLYNPLYPRQQKGIK